MKNNTINRRRFLQSMAAAGVLSGTSVLPFGVPPARAQLTGAQPLANKLLVDLFMNGGPDMRHLVVPQYVAESENTNGDDQREFARKYWMNRQRSHALVDAGQTAQQRWDNDYYHFTVGDTNANWNNALVDFGGLNSGLTFGIWKEASWLIDMFRAGHVALVFNAVGGTNRAHDLSSLMLRQGNLLSTLNDRSRSGWGGRLARSTSGASVSLTTSPSAFNFGPVGEAPNYDPNMIDNKELVSLSNSREVGLFDSQDDYEFNDADNKMARAAKSYYAALKGDQNNTYRTLNQAYQKALGHEETVRQFGEFIESRLIGPNPENPTVPIPNEIRALYEEVTGVNPDPNDITDPQRRVLRRTSFGRQIRNLYDVIALNDLINPTVCSMDYGGWDSHSQQRRVPGELAGNPGAGVQPDPNNPFVDRGIESGLRDIFGGQWSDGGGQTPSDPSSLHYGFSALWNNLTQLDRQKIAITISGEFGRQIRDNGDAGTDHGKGNLMLVISEDLQGGIYGDMFPADEIIKYDEPSNRTPDITPLTEIDHLFASVCDWVASGTGEQVFPRLQTGYPGEAPIIEMVSMFDSLFT